MVDLMVLALLHLLQRLHFTVKLLLLHQLWQVVDGTMLLSLLQNQLQVAGMHSLLLRQRVADGIPLPPEPPRPQTAGNHKEWTH